MSATCVRTDGLRPSGAAVRQRGARRSFETLTGNSIWSAPLAALMSLTVAAFSPALGQNPPAGELETLQGKLIAVGEGRPALKTAKRDYVLNARSSYLFRTLQDERLLNREVRVDGTLRPDGTFEAAHLFTVREGKLYKVRYYCSICNIAAMEPGNCVCCQRPTELQEIPLSDVGKDAVIVP
jgi:hypothetical protein